MLDLRRALDQVVQLCGKSDCDLLHRHDRLLGIKRSCRCRRGAGTLGLTSRCVKLCGMATKADLMGWAVEALEQLGGSAGVVDVSRRVWQNHEDELRRSGDLFYTWQYDLRWAATKLRKEGRLQPSTGRGVRGKWALV